MSGANVDYGWLHGFIMAGLISWWVFGHNSWTFFYRFNGLTLAFEMEV